VANLVTIDLDVKDLIRILGGNEGQLMHFCRTTSWASCFLQRRMLTGVVLTVLILSVASASRGGETKSPLEVPLKDYSKGEEYTEKEITFLTNRWSERETEEVAVWIEAGADPGERPESVQVIGILERGQEYEHLFDLRCINLRWLDASRTGDEPATRLSYAHLDHADLSYACLKDADLRDVHLECANLEHADLEGATLENAYLEHVNLEHANLEHTDLADANLNHADLRSARLDHADLSNARLKYANLRHASLKHADLGLAQLDYADLSNANLEHADLTLASIVGADLSSVFLSDTVFRNVEWGGEGQTNSDAHHFTDFDVRGIRYSDPLFDQFVRQSEFIRRLQGRWPKLVWVWRVISDGGRSPVRWLVTCGIVIAFFAALFFVMRRLGFPIVKLREGTARTWFSDVYLSIVTFLTLGFRDVVPCNWIGQVVVVIAVVAGYVMLGGMISIFIMKLVPPL